MPGPPAPAPPLATAGSSRPAAGPAQQQNRGGLCWPVWAGRYTGEPLSATGSLVGGKAAHVGGHCSGWARAQQVEHMYARVRGSARTSLGWPACAAPAVANLGDSTCSRARIAQSRVWMGMRSRRANRSRLAAAALPAIEASSSATHSVQLVHLGVQLCCTCPACRICSRAGTARKQAGLLQQRKQGGLPGAKTNEATHPEAPSHRVPLPVPPWQHVARGPPCWQRWWHLQHANVCSTSAPLSRGHAQPA